MQTDGVITKPLAFTAVECSHILMLLKRAEKDDWHSVQYWESHKHIEDKIKAYIKGE